jgi:2-keto-4-pentenoate hydratase/2-oxohepta-3-ene-1,7-dioic acid hydratase in catechol pathway
MKLATFLHRGGESFGVVTAGGICRLPDCWADGPRSVLELLQAGPEALARAEQLAAECPRPVPLDEVTLLAPVPNPPKILALAGNYVKHIRESNLAKGLTTSPALDTTPRPFLMPTTAITGTGTEIPWPRFSRQIDFEIELAVVIGSRCKCVSPAEAARHIAGYTIANDISARSTTFADGRSKRPWDEFYDWLNGKWSDAFCPTGPYLVTAAEAGDPTNLRLRLTVNGEVRQDETTASMIFDVYEIVSFLSHLMTLVPGDLIATGTPSGVGMGDGRYLSGGDVITCRIDNIGEITNTLGPAPAEFYTPCKDAT